MTVVQDSLRRVSWRRENIVLMERICNRNEELTYLNRQLSEREASSAGALSTIRRRWDAALNAISDAIVIVNPDLHIEGANAAAGRLSGLSVASMEGLLCHEVLFGRKSRCESCPLPAGTGRVQRTHNAQRQV